MTEVNDNKVPDIELKGYLSADSWGKFLRLSALMRNLLEPNRFNSKTYWLKQLYYKFQFKWHIQDFVPIIRELDILILGTEDVGQKNKIRKMRDEIEDQYQQLYRMQNRCSFLYC